MMMERSATIALALSASVMVLGGCERQTALPENGPAAQTSQADAAKPSKTGYAEVNGGRFYYQIFGDLKSGKAPLLVLHGSLMSGEAMAPLVGPLAASRPVITVDARGHGRTGDLPGPITYPGMADDAAAVLKSLSVSRADVLGYSMGGTTAILMAVRHPDLIGKQVIVSAPAERGGWYPKVQASFEQWKPEMFAGSPVQAAYKRLSATPEAFPAVINKLRELEKTNYDVAPAALRAVAGKTMIIAGDSDGVDPEYALEFFEARGGPDPDAQTKGFISQAPRARLAILPGTSHVGMMNQGELVARLTAPFFDDRPPAPPSGFFEGMDKPSSASSGASQ